MEEITASDNSAFTYIESVAIMKHVPASVSFNWLCRFLWAALLRSEQEVRRQPQCIVGLSARQARGGARLQSVPDLIKRDPSIEGNGKETRKEMFEERGEDGEFVPGGDSLVLLCS